MTDLLIRALEWTSRNAMIASYRLRARRGTFADKAVNARTKRYAEMAWHPERRPHVN